MEKDKKDIDFFKFLFFTLSGMISVLLGVLLGFGIIMLFLKIMS